MTLLAFRNTICRSITAMCGAGTLSERTKALHEEISSVDIDELRATLRNSPGISQKVEQIIVDDNLQAVLNISHDSAHPQAAQLGQKLAEMLSFVEYRIAMADKLGTTSARLTDDCHN